MADETDYAGEGEGTPSQQALDSQLAGQQAIASANYQGRIALAKTQVSEAVAEGADAAQGRELLGRLDDMAEFQTGDDNAEVYKEFKAFIKGGAASQVAQAPPPAPQRRPAPKRYGEMTSEERGKMSSAEIDAMLARQAGGEPQRPNPRVISKRMDR